MCLIADVTNLSSFFVLRMVEKKVITIIDSMLSYYYLHEYNSILIVSFFNCLLYSRTCVH